MSQFLLEACFQGVVTPLGLEDKLTAIEEQIQQLQILKQELKGLLSGWEIVPEHPEMTICPIIERN